MNHSITTATGRYIDVFAPVVAAINITDIACGLANRCRFAGQMSDFYSVAQHSVNVALVCWERTNNPSYALAGLLHDAAEAYIGDMPSPIKQHEWLDGYRLLEDRLLADIFLAHEIPFPYPEVVKQVDEVMLHCEARMLMANSTWSRLEPIPPTADLSTWSPKKAREKFLRTYFDIRATLGAVEAQRASQQGYSS